MSDVVLPNDQAASGRSFGAEELALITEALESGALTSTRGRMVRDTEKAFADLLAQLGAPDSHVVACASGSAAVHTGVAVVDPEPGEEIVTTSITDIGALTPIIYQAAVPVFADVDPLTGNVTPESVAAVLSDRTRAVIVTHLFGNPADVDGIRALVEPKGITVIEDSAQAFCATRAGRPVGSVGEFGAFSLQQGKHITSGEGGLVVTQDGDLAHKARTWINKSWPYGDPNPDHRSIALNYRMTELQGAVVLGQLAKLPALVAHRREMVDLLAEQIADVPGVAVVRPVDGATHSWWRVPLMIDLAVISEGPAGVAARLKDFDIASGPRYINKPAFRTAVFAEHKTFGQSRFPFTLARPEALDYSAERFPGTFAYLDSVLVLPFNERYQPEHVKHVANGLRDAVTGLLS